jgi:hypothetical protein
MFTPSFFSVHSFILLTICSFLASTTNYLVDSEAEPGLLFPLLVRRNRGHHQDAALAQDGMHAAESLQELGFVGHIANRSQAGYSVKTSLKELGQVSVVGLLEEHIIPKMSRVSAGLGQHSLGDVRRR